MSRDRIDLLEGDVQAHARTITELTKAIAGVDKQEALRTLRDEHLDERLDRIEQSIAATAKVSADRFAGLYRLGWWLLAAFGSSAVALIANFAFRGGFFVQ